MEFKIAKTSKKSRARLGFLKTPHGVIETPCLVPVATQAVIKTLTSEEAEQTRSQILICNAYHLHIRPGDDIVKKSGGLHKFMNWKKPLMTDSGGFQVFSLGFGRDLGTGKILNKKSTPTPKGVGAPKPTSSPALRQDVGAASVGETKFYEIQKGQQPKLLKITEDGVVFNSYLDGKKIFLGPKESMKIQENLGADIVFNFDECTSPAAGYEYTKKSLEKTHRWAKICLKTKNQTGPPAGRQALFGIVQGGKYKDLRKASAKFMASLPFDGFGIGGEFGDDKNKMTQMLDWAIEELPAEKPRHLLGIGHLDDIAKIVKSGVDTFDCIAPTHYARRGFAFVSSGKLDMGKKDFLTDKNSLDKNCNCQVCQNYTRAYISHLFRAGELTALRLITFHNLYYFNTFIEKIREQIKQGRI
ncbi:MAG: tRNA guanosine(34) transglycosylase Tgt [Patescibacteria group bacterium]